MTENSWGQAGTYRDSLYNFRNASDNPYFQQENAAEEMEAAERLIRSHRSVALKNFEVKTFNLGDAKQVKEYKQTLKRLHEGVQALTHVILFHDRKVGGSPEAPIWFVHLEWAEFIKKEEA